jgi:hypothetical protein
MVAVAPFEAVIVITPVLGLEVGFAVCTVIIILFPVVPLEGVKNIHVSRFVAVQVSVSLVVGLKI